MGKPSKFSDCHSVVLNNIQLRNCSKGCLLLGSCVESCPSDAIRISDFSLNIDHNLCTGCGLCVEACPTKIKSLLMFEEIVDNSKALASWPTKQ